MDQLTVKQIGNHVNILGWVYILGNALFLILGGFLWVLLAGIGAVSGDAEAFRVLTFIGTICGVSLIFLGIPGILAGVGLLKRQPWARILALVLGVIGLVNVPLGTVIGVYAIWVLLQDEASEYFSPA